MALTGLQIYKLLPKTNCGKCGFPTCLAFAMALAGKKTELAQCPDVSEEAKTALGEASSPPIRLVTIGAGDRKAELGNETVMFRHEQTFYHKPVFAMRVDDTLSPDDLQAKKEKLKKLSFDRVGMVFGVEMIALKNSSGNPVKFAGAAGILNDPEYPMILITSDPAAMEAALEKAGSNRPLIYAADESNWEKMCELAKKYSCPLVVKAKGLEALGALVEKVKGAGVADIILDSEPENLHEALRDQVQVRRLALKKNNRTYGYPTIAFCGGDDIEMQAARASAFIDKYAGVIVLDVDEPWQALSIITLRLNIYTDPQKPIQMEAKIYPVGQVTDESPVLVTTNFSLTYFTVAGEIEASKIPAYLVIVDTDGTSVLTAWAADKFNPETISKAMKQYGIEGMVKHRSVIIPGYVAVISGGLEEESGWKVDVGPKEAAGIPAYLKKVGPKVKAPA
ncbi:MAG: acetyl-CoA decarbonylase/synthase complex subunit gamma [Chloroflexi bacterium]|nr:acetyl-CoA decarbonylase/synthase complex subunit gamma [Chloroflexota bacterium]